MERSISIFQCQVTDLRPAAWISGNMNSGDYNEVYLTDTDDISKITFQNTGCYIGENRVDKINYQYLDFINDKYL